MPDSSHKPTLREVYQSEFAYVVTTLRRFGVPSRHVEDVAHDVFVVVHRKLADYDPSRPIRPWLFGIAYRVALDHGRKASNRREIPSDEVQDVASPDDSGERVRDARARVMRALDAVPLERRAVFVLHELDGLPMKDVAASFSIPLHTAYSRLKKARKEFTAAVRQNQQEDA